MIKKPELKVVEPPKRSSLSRKDGFLILLAMIGLLVVGVAGSMLINWLNLDNKVDVPDYPNSQKAALTVKGTSFINDRYTSASPSSDYYKVWLTTDSCEMALGFYRTEAPKKDWISDRQGGTDGVNVLVDTYKKSSKGLFVYCTPGSAQLAENSDGKNIILILAADGVLDLNPSLGSPQG